MNWWFYTMTLRRSDFPPDWHWTLFGWLLLLFFLCCFVAFNVCPNQGNLSQFSNTKYAICFFAFLNFEHWNYFVFECCRCISKIVKPHTVPPVLRTFCLRSGFNFSAMHKKRPYKINMNSFSELIRVYLSPISTGRSGKLDGLFALPQPLFLTLAFFSLVIKSYISPVGIAWSDSNIGEIESSRVHQSTFFSPRWAKYQPNCSPEITISLSHSIPHA